MLERLAVLDLTRAEADRLGLRSPSLALRRVWPRSPGHLLLEYVGRDGAGDEDRDHRIVPGQWMSDAAELERVLAKTAGRSAGCAPFLVTTGQDRVMLQPGGADRRLTALGALLARPGATLISHRPERRAVVRIERPDGVLFAKVVRPPRTRGVAAAARTVFDLPGRRFAVPAVLDEDEAGGVVTFSALGGSCLFDLLAEGDRLVAGARAAGAALRSLHDAPPPPDAAEHDAAAEIRLLEERVDGLARLAPVEYRHVAAAAPGVLAALAEGRSASALVHRDFYDKQIFIDDADAVGLLDFDTLAVGEPALDLANTVVHLELRALQGRCSPEGATAAAIAFIDGYHAVPEVIERAGVYRDATRLRLACLYALRPRWRSLSAELTERIGRSLGCAAGSPAV